MVASIALPRLMRVGAGASRLLPEVLGQLGLSRPFVVTDPYLAGSGRTDTLLERLTRAGAKATIFSETVPDPTVASVEAALAALKAGEFDCVVGFGGGSPMDTAKAVAVLARHGGHMRDYKAPRQQDEPGLPIVAIPTTAGTGSEATRFTIVTDEASDEKMLCIGLAYLPVAALVDYELTLTKPKRLTADTGIDALTHAIEAYVSRKANMFSDGLALQAMGLIAPNLRRVWTDPGDRAAREAMMLGATQAGIAFSNASVALVHGMSRPISGPSTCTVVMEGTMCAPNSALPKPVTARSCGTRRPRARASTRMPWASMSELHITACSPGCRSISSPSARRPRSNVLGAGTTAVGTSRPQAARKPSRRCMARWSLPVAMPMRS